MAGAFLQRYTRLNDIEMTISGGGRVGGGLRAWVGPTVGSCLQLAADTSLSVGESGKRSGCAVIVQYPSSIVFARYGNRSNETESAVPGLLSPGLEMTGFAGFFAHMLMCFRSDAAIFHRFIFVCRRSQCRRRSSRSDTKREPQPPLLQAALTVKKKMHRQRKQAGAAVAKACREASSVKASF